MKDIERYAAIAAAVEMLEKSGMYFELTIRKTIKKNNGKK